MFFMFLLVNKNEFLTNIIMIIFKELKNLDESELYLHSIT